MFNKNKFKKLIEKSIGTKSTTQYANECGVNRTYISKIINQKLANPPSPEILRKLANSSQERISYKELMTAAGYLEGINSVPHSERKQHISKIPVVKSFTGEIFTTDNIKSYRYIDQINSTSTSHFFIELKKDYLNQKIIKANSLGLIETEAELKNGDTAAVILNGQELIRKVYFTDKSTILLSDTINSKAKIVAKKDIKIIGKCIIIILQL